MKKFILSAAFLAFAAVATVNANDIKAPLAITAPQDSTTKTPVKPEELPDAVKATLQSDKYKEWVPQAAFLVTAANKTEWYQVDVKKGEETASLKIGKDGSVIQ
ncbi:hypothetical protein [Pedobacter nutrimenti]|jgi:hypothetical protein|uniref:PepSY-like beta-lactamase-inhibitor n=1 Tax=Pedobacter nutrimenti TaxID=1241337 RepID=A0A318UM01_9SPHI|nr:hypothetical protein [Pedobacter nutrimenti]PYF70131.1 hypothetical protein B0O44_109228 [Pedobacter nutrimenti]|eukprot:gene4780-5567_t